MALKFQGGIKLSECRNTKKLPITFMDRSSVVTFDMGENLIPCVSGGDMVKKYEKIASDNEGFTIS
ncbi:MAG: hypothetical protein EOM87_07275, partial [Clostridia bacterium]|nr:hypothetical protein [Clostridia bacterium]